MSSQIPDLEARSAGYEVDKTRILSDVSFSIYPGRIYAVIGPNGAGKSTLIRLLCLLIPPATGKVMVQGEDATGSWPNILHLRRRLALVTQMPTMFKCSVFDNAAAGLKFRRLPKKEVRERVEKALSFVSMDHLRKRFAPTISMGEAQMVALARALVLEPAVMLLDEPTSNLDPRNTRRLEEHLLKVNQERGTTVVMVTHSLKQAERLAHEVIFIHAGKVIETGEAASFFAHPREKKTRSFLDGQLIV